MARFARNNSKPKISAGSSDKRLKSTESASLPYQSQSSAEIPLPQRDISTFVPQWRGTTSSRASNIPSRDPRPKHIPIEISPYQFSRNAPHHTFPGELLSSTSPSLPRLPKHVPIVIPEFAQPFIPEPLPPTQVKRRQIQPTSNPGKRKVTNQKANANASQLEGSQPPTTKGKRNLVDDEDDFFAMNSSQVSLSTASESGADSVSVPSRSTSHAGQTNLGITSPTTQNGGTANLSGLVCNVHRTTGDEPHALVGATTTILGDKLYVFGGRIHSRTKPKLTSDLYELDLLKRHWTKLEVVGDVPPPRYFHSVCALGDSKLVCYGGMSPAPHLRNSQNKSAQSADAQPEVVVMSDIHIFDVARKEWILVCASTTGTDGPQGRYAHCATILPSAAVFSSVQASHSAIRHNRGPSEGSAAHSGTLGVHIDGPGGAEMIVVGGQDSANNYIEQISVFNLRNLKWTSTTQYDHKCGAYKSMVAPLVGLDAENIGRGVPLDNPPEQKSGTSTLIYSNYNFLEVKLELQIRLPNGSLIERPMAGKISPPGLRFPNGGIINNHFVVSGTYLTSSKHEYALWALDLRTLTWGRIDTAGSVFSQASWNRGILWNRRNMFVILGHRKRNLVEDYNHRRINFSHICIVELEAFGLYENPRKSAPASAYVSMSSPIVPISLQPSLTSSNAGGRQLSSVAEQLGQTALTINELSDMEIVAIGGEKLPCNSRLLARRWGPYFIDLLLQSSTQKDSLAMSDATTLRNNMHSQASRNSTLTITPSAPSGAENASAPDNAQNPQRSMSQSTTHTLVELPNSNSIPASSRARLLYLPHTAQTIRLLLQYLYTSSLPPVTSSLCSPHTLCSLLQLARPYQVDGLLEATVQRLHEVLDGRNAAAVFNAAAMAAGGGRATSSGVDGTTRGPDRRETQPTATSGAYQSSSMTAASSHLQVGGNHRRGHSKSSSVDSGSTTTSASTSTGLSQTDTESSAQDMQSELRKEKNQEVWTGDISSVIGLQKRGLRGLMEGRRLRERANTAGTADS